MNVIFLTLIDITDINERGIYHDLLRKFRDEGHQVFIISPNERRKGRATAIHVQDGITLLKVRTLNIQKTNIIEKGIGTLLLEYQYLNALKNHFSNVRFDLVLYSTPPITLTKVVAYIKQKDRAISYLLLKDIFPQNAVDLGMMKKDGTLHRFFARKEKQLYAISDFIGCMSPANVRYLLKHNPSLDTARVEVNPNSIATVEDAVLPAERKSIRSKYKISLDSVAFIYGGNLGKPQGIDFLIEVLESNLNNKNKSFVIVGGGTEFKLLDSWHKKNNPCNVLLLQSVPKKEYDQLIKACDVGLIFLDKRFTIPNFPSRLLSYLECKIPVLAATDANTDIGEIIEASGSGFWTLSGDLKRYNELLDRFVGNSQLLFDMGERGNQLLKKDYVVDVSYKAIADKF